MNCLTLVLLVALQANVPQVSLSAARGYQALSRAGISQLDRSLDKTIIVDGKHRWTVSMPKGSGTRYVFRRRKP